MTTTFLRRVPAAMLLMASVVVTQLSTAEPAAAVADNPRSAPTTFDTGTVWDLANEFFLNHGDARYADGDPGQIHKQILYPNNQLVILKQRDNPNRWERFLITPTTIELNKDTTNAPSGQYSGYVTHNSYMPRYWQVGQEIRNRGDGAFDFFDINSCQWGQHRSFQPEIGRKYLRYQGPLNVGGDLGVQDVIVIDHYFYLDANPNDQNYWNPVEAERTWYMRGRGWVRWEHFPNREAIGPNGYAPWNARTTNDLQNPWGADITVSFNREWPAGNSMTATPVCPNIQ